MLKRGETIGDSMILSILAVFFPHKAYPFWGIFGGWLKRDETIGDSLILSILAVFFPYKAYLFWGVVEKN